MITIHVLPAKSGDCILLEFDTNQCILIDCGYKETYKQHLKPLLIELNQAGKDISLLIITHIDEDHISGAIDLINDNGDYNNARIIKVQNIWINGFRNLVFSKPFADDIGAFQRRQMRLAKATALSSSVKEDNEYISATQLKEFESICAKAQYPINKQFEGETVIQSSGIFFGNIEIDVLSPSCGILNRQSEFFEKKLKMLFGEKYDIADNNDFRDFYYLLMLGNNSISKTVTEDISIKRHTDILEWLGSIEHEPLSIPNRSSIVVEIKYKGCKLLFCGDADAYDYSDKLDSDYDVVKLSHHGSASANIGMIDKIKAKHYIISTNGSKYDHPDKRILARLIMKRGQKRLHFNYNLDTLGLLECEMQKKKYLFEASFNENNFVVEGYNEEIS